MENAMKTPPAQTWDDNVVLSVEHLTMRFGGLLAVNDLSFNVGRGDITALIGPNGAGKTTVFNCIAGFYKPTVGRLTLRRDGRPYLLERMQGHHIAHHARVARTFQNIRLFARIQGQRRWASECPRCHPGHR